MSLQYDCLEEHKLDLYQLIREKEEDIIDSIWRRVRDSCSHEDLDAVAALIQDLLHPLN